MKMLIDARPLVDGRAGGVGRVALELVDALAREFANDEITCVTTGWKRSALPDRLLAHKNISHWHINIPNKLWSLGSMLGLVSFEEKKFEAVFYPNLGFVGKARSRKIRRTLLLHDLSFLIEPRWFSRKQRLWHRLIGVKQQVTSATRVLTVSETTTRDAEQFLGVARERMMTMPIGLTLPMVEASGEWQVVSRPYVLALGGNDPRKNVATAQAAVAEFTQRTGLDMELVVVGAGGVRPTDAELDALYRGAKAFLYPSWYEGYGLPLHEAAARGTPCLASTAGALPETAPKGTLFADPSKGQHWVEGLRLILEMKRPEVEVGIGENWVQAAKMLRESFR